MYQGRKSEDDQKKGEDKTEQEDITCRSQIWLKIIEINFPISDTANL